MNDQFSWCGSEDGHTSICTDCSILSNLSLLVAITHSSVAGIRTKPMVTLDSINGRYLVTWLDERTSDGVAIYGHLFVAMENFKEQSLS